MKIISNKFFILISFLFGFMDCIAKGGGPPTPFGKRPPPPGLPIDKELFVLLIIAVLFGIYIIHTRQLYKKTSI